MLVQMRRLQHTRAENVQTRLRFGVPHAVRTHQRQTGEVGCLRLAVAAHRHVDEAFSRCYKQVAVGGLVEKDEVGD